jgi:hypothetical protein
MGMEESPAEPMYDPRGTLNPGDARATLRPGEGGQIAEGQRIGLSETEQSEEHDRLEYLCHLIRRERHPICPVNGMLALLPYEIISKGKLEAVKVQRALSEDTATIRNVLRLRFPTVAMVVGMEEEPGFGELVRRVGRSAAERRRIGHGFDVWTPPIPERLEALCAHSCAAFEDWTYHLFGEKDSLSRPGNTQLFLLLCKVRRNLKDRLTDIIVEGFKYDPERNSTNGALLFTGCYFAATGEQSDRQALIQEQRNARIGRIIWIVDLILFIILIVCVWFFR